MKKKIAVWLAPALLSVSVVFSQSSQTPMPQIIEKNGRHALLVDGAPYFMLGGQVHNSSAWPGMMPNVWQAAEKMHLNTLEVPLYWEQIEPQQGRFDFSLADTLLAQARSHNVHLVLLWFATWKNGSSHYMPGWMKEKPDQYPNIIGVTGKPVDSPSPHIQATLNADMQAFAAVMKHLKSVDAQHTIIMVQVENEPGAWGSVRDYSPTAQKLFEGAVPAELLKPDVLSALHVPLATSGNWKKVFWDRADEYFQAWSVAKYIGQVAAAGKKEYALPMYVNAALRDPLTNPTANNYESGGATDNVIAIWKAAAPAIDLVAPDIYLSGSERVLKVIDLYNRSDNALFVPEAGLMPDNAKYLYAVLAGGGIGFSPFGIDDNGRISTEADMTDRLAPFAQEYAVVAPMMIELAKQGFAGQIKAAVQREDGKDQTIDLGAWQAIVSFGSGRRPDGAAPTPSTAPPNGKLMIVQLEKDQFLLVGTRCGVTFQPMGANAGKAWQYGKVEEGEYQNGDFQVLRIRNGDETDFGGPRFGAVPVVLRTTLVVR